MTKYKNELTKLKQNIPNLDYFDYKNYKKITIEGESYLVIPKEDKNYNLAVSMCDFGYIGKLAVYLEIEYSAIKFLNSI